MSPPDDSFPAARPQRPPLGTFPTRMAERLGVVDAAAKPLGSFIRAKLGPGPVKDALSGTWLGHPLHPLMTDVVIGCWLSAAILDLVGGRQSERASRTLIAGGLVASAPTVASGWSDWADTSVYTEVRRVGIVHAVINATGIGLHGASLAARLKGRPGKGKLLSLTGTGLLGIGGFLGGHLSFVKGVGVNETVFEEGPDEWTPALAVDEVQEGKVSTATVDGVRLLVARHEGRLVAMSDRCTHRGGPLHEGELEDGCVRCPWHGSVFSLSDGSVVGGPASVPQPVYDVRVADGQVEVRLNEAEGR